MTILQILPALHTGGVELHVVELARALVGAGHDCLAVSSGGSLEAEIRAAGARHAQLPVARKSLTSLRSIPSLSRLIQRERPSVVHAHSRLPAWLALAAIRAMSAQTRPAFITTFHGFHSVNAYSGVMARGDHVVAVSKCVAAHAQEQYPRLAKRPLHIIPGGVDPATFPHGHVPPDDWRAAWAAQFPETVGKRLAVLPGRLTRLKGHSVFLRALALAEDPNLHGVILGGADPRKAAYVAELRALTADLGLSDRVTFTGARSDMRDALAHADVVCAFSVKPESFGRTVLEALSVGTPVIGFDHGGVGEILGELYPEGRILFEGEDLALIDRAAAALDVRPALPKPPPPYYHKSREMNALLALYGAV